MLYSLQILNTLTFIALLNPEAKKPPKGETRLVNKARTNAWAWNSVAVNEKLPRIL
jgi:hypothetical protein